MLNQSSVSTTTNNSALPLTSAQKQADNFLAHRSFHAAIAEEIRAEEGAKKENAPSYDAIQNGIWTIYNNVKGTHKTFKIHTARNGKFTDRRFLSVLDGSDNENDYSGFAFISPDGKSIRVWHAKRSDGVKSDYEKYADILVDLFVNGGKKYGKFCSLEGATTCLRCNRLLTVPSSIDARYGKECAKKIINFNYE